MLGHRLRQFQMVFMQLQRLFPSTIQLHHGDIGIAVHQVRSQFCGDLRYSSFKYPNVALNGANAIIPKVPGRRRVLAHHLSLVICIPSPSELFQPG